jgi:signal transduction histidine kinase
MRSKLCVELDINSLRLTRQANSESVRLAAAAAGIFILATGALIAAVLWIVADTQRSALLRDSEADISSVFAGFTQDGLGEAEEVVRQRLSDSGRAASESGIYISIEDAGRQVVAGNLPPLPHRSGAFETRLLGAAGTPPVDVFGEGRPLGAEHYLFVGRDLGPLRAARMRILQAFLWVLLGAIVVAAAGGFLLAARLINRVDAITRTCENITAGRLQERIPLTGNGAEWDRLSRAINDMLSRIEALLQNLQQVSSDVAHDLRTPLTRMRNRLEVAHNSSSIAAEYSLAMTRAIEDTDEILSLFGALLRISQIEAGTRAGSFKPVDLSALLLKVEQIFKPVAEDHRQQLDTRLAANVKIMGDQELLLQMFSNLVENSITHTPAGTRIRVDLQRSSAGQVVAGVADDGPGIPAAESSKVTRRFYRLSSSRSSPGHGLGLALVDAIAQLHGGRLALSDGNPGLKVDVLLKELR